MAKKAPGMMLYENNCDVIFSILDDEELGRVLRDAWEYYQVGTLPDYDKKNEKHIILAFNAMKASVDAGVKAYAEKVENGAIGGIVGQLARCDGFTKQIVNDQIEFYRSQGKSDAEIAVELKKMYAAAKAQTA